jgi:hypothetical protein
MRSGAQAQAESRSYADWQAVLGTLSLNHPLKYCTARDTDHIGREEKSTMWFLPCVDDLLSPSDNGFGYTEGFLVFLYTHSLRIAGIS